MSFIHELPDWPRLRWDMERLAGQLADVRHRQGRLLGHMLALGFDLRAEASLSTLTADVVKTSAIEGEHLDAAEVRSSIARRLSVDAGGAGPASRDVEAIVEVMLDATQNFQAPLTQERLFGWHSALFPAARSGMQRITVGAWRTGERGAMQVVSGPVHAPRVHFEAPHASRVPAEMDAFLSWFESPPQADPVLISAAAHFWFVTIHPFEDGNGRIARAIADLALARADGTAQRFYSMSAQIEAERKDYYLILERSQRGTTDITPWMEWYLACLGRALNAATGTLATTLRKAHVWERANRFPLNPRQRQVLNRLLDGFEGKLTTSKYAKLAKCSEDTALRDIRSLIEYGVFHQNDAGGRSTSYAVAEG